MSSPCRRRRWPKARLYKGQRPWPQSPPAGGWAAVQDHVLRGQRLGGLCHPFEIQKRPKKEGYKPNFYSAIPYAIYAYLRSQDRPAEVQLLGMGTLLAGSLASFRKTLRYFYPVQETAEALRTEATGQKSRSTASRRISTGKRARRAFVNSASRSVLIPWFRSCETSAAALCEASPRFAPHRAGRHRTRPHRWR